MNDENIQINNGQITTDDVALPVIADEEIAVVAPAVPVVARGKITPGRRMRDSARKGGNRGADIQKSGRGRDSGRGGEGRERIKPEFDSKTIDIRRVTRVAAGGRRFTFSVAAVVGDHKGRVGVGLGKGADTALSVEKAVREAKKHLIKIPLSPQMVIPHAAQGKFGSAIIKIFPARGSGIVAGSSARTVIELAGIKDICAKIMSGSKNKINIARATIVALERLSKISKTVLRGKNK
jgi:small subunit ribosomal protein S5